MGTINDSIENPTTIYVGIKHCIETILTKNPLTTIIMITPTNRSQIGNSGASSLTKENNFAYGTQNTAGYTLSDVCQAIVNCANYYGISYIDNREGCPIKGKVRYKKNRRGRKKNRRYSRINILNKRTSNRNKKALN